MKILRLEKYQKNDISFYLALEEYLLNTVEDDVFFLWDINKSVIIGRNQLLEAEVNMEYVKKINAKIYRRLSGGGAIYADEGCFMFSFILKSENKELKDVIFKKYLSLIVNALEKINISTYFSGRNDLLVNSKKFSGNSFYKTNKGIVLHGTFLFETNLLDLVKVVTPDNEKLISKGIKSVFDRVINIGEFTSLKKPEMMNYLLNEIGESEINITDDDYLKIKEIEKKYLSDEWIKGNNPAYTFKNEKRFSYGKISVFIDVKKNKVKAIDLKGDFLMISPINEFLEMFIDLEFSISSFKEILKNNKIDKYILGCSNEDFINLIFEEEY